MSTMWKRLREERVRLGLNQDEMGEIGGVSRTSQSNYEKGERSPDMSYLGRLVEHGVDVDYILKGIRSEPNTSASNTEQLTPQEGALLEKYRHLSDSDKAHMQAVVGAFVVQGTVKKAVS